MRESIYLEDIYNIQPMFPQSPDAIIFGVSEEYAPYLSVALTFSLNQKKYTEWEGNYKSNGNRTSF